MTCGQDHLASEPAQTVSSRRGCVRFLQRYNQIPVIKRLGPLDRKKTHSMPSVIKHLVCFIALKPGPTPARVQSLPLRTVWMMKTVGSKVAMTVTAAPLDTGPLSDGLFVQSRSKPARRRAICGQRISIAGQRQEQIQVVDTLVCLASSPTMPALSIARQLEDCAANHAKIDHMPVCRKVEYRANRHRATAASQLPGCRHVVLHTNIIKAMWQGLGKRLQAVPLAMALKWHRFSDIPGPGQQRQAKDVGIGQAVWMPSDRRQFNFKKCHAMIDVRGTFCKLVPRPLGDHMKHDWTIQPRLILARRRCKG
jgi:hypothetical protein